MTTFGMNHEPQFPGTSEHGLASSSLTRNQRPKSPLDLRLPFGGRRIKALLPCVQCWRGDTEPPSKF